MAEAPKVAANSNSILKIFKCFSLSTSIECCSEAGEPSELVVVTCKLIEYDDRKLVIGKGTLIPLHFSSNGH